MLSMTGYGRGEYKDGGIEIVVEIKTVNNRYLDMSIKTPRIFVAYEDVIRSIVKDNLTRGHADIYINFLDKRKKDRTICLDENIAAAYVGAADKLKNLFPTIQNDLTITNILRFPDVIKTDDIQTADDDSLTALKTTLSLALDKLNKMRKAEGEKLKQDLLDRMRTIISLVKSIQLRAPLVVDNYREKLNAKITKILDNMQVDESRLITEVALFADKSNIDEELTRLNSHITQFEEICKDSIVGRKLDFLVQEFNRESNTICSKSNDVEITRLALALKNEIEKVREQIQNIE